MSNTTNPPPIPEEFRNWAKQYADGNSIDAHPKIREHLNAELYEAIINTYRHLSPTGESAWTERLKYLEALINSPEIDDFLKGLQLEAAHQTERWSVEAEEKKMPHHYACVMDKLKGKMAMAIFDGNIEKYKHHLVTLAAVCFNVHRQIDKEGTAIHNYFHPPHLPDQYNPE